MRRKRTDHEALCTIRIVEWSWKGLIIREFQLLVLWFRTTGIAACVCVRAHLWVSSHHILLQLPMDWYCYWEEEYDGLSMLCGSGVCLPHFGYLTAHWCVFVKRTIALMNVLRPWVWVTSDDCLSCCNGMDRSLTWWLFHLVLHHI